MANSIEVKLCSGKDYKAFIYAHDKDGYLHTDLGFAKDALQFINELPSVFIESGATLVNLSKLIWQEDEYVKHTEEAVVFKRVDGQLMDRTFCCYQLSIWRVPVTKTIGELYYKDHVLLVWDEDWQRSTEGLEDLRLALTRSKNPWPRHYTLDVSDELPDTDTDKGLKGVILTTRDLSGSLAAALRKDFGDYMMPAELKMEMIFLEKENEHWDKSFLEYWDDRLTWPGQFEAFSLVGYTTAMPYSYEELLKALPEIEGLENKRQLLLYRDLDEGYLLLEIDRMFIHILEWVLRTLYYVDGLIKSKVSRLKEDIESRLELVELPPFKSAPGSRERMQESVARSKEKKLQEQQGKIAPEDVYKAVDKIFKEEGKELESFAYFKEKFLIWYPEVKRRVLKGLPGA